MSTFVQRQTLNDFYEAFRDTLFILLPLSKFCQLNYSWDGIFYSDIFLAAVVR